MADERGQRLLSEAASHPASRRTVLKGAVAAGLAATTGAATLPARSGVAGARAAQEPTPGGTLTLALSVDVSNLDPHIYKGSIDLLVDNLIYDTLLDQDPETGELLPRLAESWEMPSETEVIFTLRPDVVFSDGTPMNAEVVKKSFDRNKEAVKGSTFYATLGEIEVIDDLTVRFNLTRPYAPILTNLTVGVGGVLSPQIIDKGSVDGVEDVIGTGPFKLTSWVPQQELVLERNENYWGEPPYLDHVVLKIVTDESGRMLALRAGDVDGIVNPPATEIAGLRNDGELSVLLSPQSRIVWIGFNFQDELLASNLKLRQAVAHAIDTESIVEFALEGIVRLADAGPIPPEILPTEPPLRFAYDPEQARQFLDEAGYADGIALELWSPSGRYFGDRAIAEVAQQQLAEVGIDVELQILEWGALQDAYTNHEQQLFILGWGYGGSADSALGRIFQSESNVNWSGYQNPTLDEMLVEASEIFDRQQQIEAYSAISKLLMDEVVMVPVYYAVNVWVTSSRVHDLVVHPQEVIYLNTTWIEQ